MKDKARNVFLISAVCVLLPTIAISAFMEPTAAGTLGYAWCLVGSAVFCLLAATLLTRMLLGENRSVAFAGIVPAGTALMAVSMAVSKMADQPMFLFGGFIFGVVVAVIALQKNLDELVSPKLLMAVSIVQMMVLYYVINR